MGGEGSAADPAARSPIAANPDTGGALPGPAYWLGTKNGYSGGDLTSLQVAYRNYEVARPDPTISENEVLELRIHGVGGATPESNLETPSTLMTAGDKKAGFHRAWFPGQNSARTPLREAYCWGRFSFAGLTSALWLLLLPFALVNLASWALPASLSDSEGEDWRRVRRLSRVVLRLLGLAFTAAFISTTCFLLVDIVAREAANNDQLPSWLGFYDDWDAGVREAAALGLVLAVLAGLRGFGHFTTGRYEGWASGNDLSDQPWMRLAAPTMWQGSESVRRQQFCHVLGACALVLVFAGLAFGSGTWQMRWGLGAAVVMGGFAIAVLSTPGCDRLWGTQDGWALPKRLQVFLERATWTGTGAAVVYVGWAGPEVHVASYDVENWLLHGTVLVEFALLALLVLLLALQQPWKQRDVFVCGFLSALLTGLAVAIATIFGGALLLAVVNLLSTPSLAQSETGQKISVPGVVTSGSLAFLAASGATIIVGCAMYLWRRRLKNILARPGARASGIGSTPWVPRDIPVAEEYRLDAGSVGYEAAVKKVASIWATSRMTDRAGAVGAWVCVPTLAVLFIAEWFSVFDPGRLENLLVLVQWGGTLTAAATFAFIGFLRGALVSEAQRRKFAFFWDVVNFWPRAAHPFAPPCYAERVVPEVVTRIRRIVGDVQRGSTDPAVGQIKSEREGLENPEDGFEPHRPVVLNGYSQGSPISIAVMAQLPGETHQKVALLTLACPAHRLYGRAFPRYFGPDQLEALKDKLTGLTPGAEPIKATRWINMCRRSDYVGGPVGMDLDQWILDPPALWSASNPTPPPAHLHSDWFPDPMTHPPVAVLRELLPQLPRPVAAPVAGANGSSLISPETEPPQ